MLSREQLESMHIHSLACFEKGRLLVSKHTGRKQASFTNYMTVWMLSSWKKRGSQSMSCTYLQAWHFSAYMGSFVRVELQGTLEA